MLWLKFTHIAALSIWMAGLFYIPALIAFRRTAGNAEDFVRLRISSQFVFMIIASPAACLAVASGTALLFFTDVRHPWMLAKLAGVGMLAVCHYRFGSLLAGLSGEDQNIPVIRARVITAIATIAALLVLWMVLAKPVFGEGPLPAWMTEPSGILSSRLPSDHSE